jgi:hypothetical protein
LPAVAPAPPSRVSALSATGHWRPASVVGSRAEPGGVEELRVHFDGYASKWDEWIPARSTRIVTWGAGGAGALDTTDEQPAVAEAAAARSAARPSLLPTHALAAAPRPAAEPEAKAAAPSEAERTAAEGFAAPGAAVAAESVRGLWHPATVRAVRGGQALVHFDGYANRRAPPRLRPSPPGPAISARPRHPRPDPPLSSHPPPPTPSSRPAPFSAQPPACLRPGRAKATRGYSGRQPACLRKPPTTATPATTAYL